MNHGLRSAVYGQLTRDATLLIIGKRAGQQSLPQSNEAPLICSAATFSSIIRRICPRSSIG